MNPTAPVLTLDHLQALAAQATGPGEAASTSARRPTEGRGWDPAEIEAALTRTGVEWETGGRPWGTLYRLARCLTSPEHEDGACIGRFASGAWWYRCHHNRCQDKRWPEARTALGLDSQQDWPTLTVVPGGMTDKPSQAPAPRTVSAPELARLVLPDPHWAVPDLLPEGIALLVGKGKIGKSWLALGLGITTASGGLALGTRPVERGRVLYLALEDNLRRLQRRLAARLGSDPAPPLLEFETAWTRLDAGGLEALGAWLEAHPDARLVILDTLARIRGRTGRVARLYDDDYQALEGLKALADRYNVAIVVIHHTRKADADDVLDMVSGTTGLTGAADSILVLKRTRGQADATLFATGRHLEDTELALKWDAATVSWTELGDAAACRLSKERADILGALRAEPAAPKDMAETLGKKAGAVRKLMWAMAQDGLIRADEAGRYHVCGNGNNGNAGNGVVGTQAGTGPAAGRAVTLFDGDGNAPPPAEGPDRAGVTAVTVTSVTAVTRDDQTGCETCGGPLAAGERAWCAGCRADAAAQVTAAS
jgi:hypothetical protein